MRAQSAAMSVTTENPLLSESTLPYQLPPFTEIRAGHFRPALNTAMLEQREEVERIASNPQAPTFDNTVEQLECSGRKVTRINIVLQILSFAAASAELDAVETELAPVLALHVDKLYQNAALFRRVQQIYSLRDSLGLDSESVRLVEWYHRQFVRAGAALNTNAQRELRLINEQLSELMTEFQQAVSKASKAAAVIVDSRDELEGLTDEQIAAAAAAAAEAKGYPGKWAILLTHISCPGVLGQIKCRSLRRRIYEASTTRGLGGPTDTTGLVTRIAQLRAARAQILGYANHAEYVIEGETADSPSAVNKFLDGLASGAARRAKAERLNLQAAIDEEAKKAGSAGFALEPWDWDFYGTQIRRQKHQHDERAVREYFEVNKVLTDGLLRTATMLYGLTFRERPDLPAYHPDVRTFEVIDIDDQGLGLILFDLFARPTKGGGSYAIEIIEQSQLFETKGVSAVLLSVSKAPSGQPTLLAMEEVEKAFHEFGHALHSLMGQVKYARFCALNSPRDWSEFPSMFNEALATDRAVLANYARHWNSGAQLPADITENLLAAWRDRQGVALVEWVAAAVIDQAWHQLSADRIIEQHEVETFEKSTLKSVGIDIPGTTPRMRSTYFQQIFSNPDYSSAYYSYLLTEAMAKNALSWMQKHGGLTRANGETFRRKILEHGSSVDPLVLFRNFYGNEPDIKPMLKARGLL